MSNGENTLHGRMRIDYFNFYCPDCENEEVQVHFDGHDPALPALPQFTGTCPNCNRSFTFKSNISGIPQKQFNIKLSI